MEEITYHWYADYQLHKEGMLKARDMNGFITIHISQVRKLSSTDIQKSIRTYINNSIINSERDMNPGMDVLPTTIILKSFTRLN